MFRVVLNFFLLNFIFIFSLIFSKAFADGIFNLPISGPVLNSAWSGTNVSAGGVINTGNTNSQNINSAVNLSYTKKRWDFTSNDTFNFARTEGSGVTASKLFLSGQAQYNFAIKNYSFLESDYTDDRFDGYQYTLNSIVGYGRRLVNTPKFNWDVQGGPGFQHAVKNPNEDSAGENQEENNFLLNASSQISWALSPNANVSENLSAVSTQINTRTISTTAITANLISQFAMQLSFQAIHDSLPLSGKKNLNTVSTISLVYTLA